MADNGEKTDECMPSSSQTTNKTVSLGERQSENQDDAKDVHPDETASNEDNSNDKKKAVDDLVISSIDILRIKNKFLENVEELRILRASDFENAQRIKELVTETHEMERKVEDVLSANKAQKEQHTRDLAEVRKQMEQKMHNLESEKNQTILKTDIWEKEVKTLKEQLKLLLVDKYSIEKTLKEKEHRIQMQSSAADSHISQMRALEGRCKDLMDDYGTFREQLSTLNAEVKCATELNNKLSRLNAHQKCLIASLTEENTEKRDEIIKIRVEHESKSKDGNAYSMETNATIQRLQELVADKEKNNQKLEKRHKELKEEQQRTLAALSESHLLTDRHLDSSLKSAEDVSRLKEQLRQTKSSLESTEQQLTKTQEELDAEMKKKEIIESEFKSQIQDIETDLKKCQDKCEDTSKAYHNMEELNNSLAKKHVEVEASMQNLREEVKDKDDQLHQYQLQITQAKYRPETQDIATSTYVTTVDKKSGPDNIDRSGAAPESAILDATVTMVTKEDKITSNTRADKISGISDKDNDIRDDRREVMIDTTKLGVPPTEFEMDRPKLNLPLTKMSHSRLSMNGGDVCVEKLGTNDSTESGKTELAMPKTNLDKPLTKLVTSTRRLGMEIITPDTVHNEDKGVCNQNSDCVDFVPMQDKLETERSLKQSLQSKERNQSQIDQLIDAPSVSMQSFNQPRSPEREEPELGNPTLETSTPIIQTLLAAAQATPNVAGKKASVVPHNMQLKMVTQSQGLQIMTTLAEDAGVKVNAVPTTPLEPSVTPLIPDKMGDLEKVVMGGEKEGRGKRVLEASSLATNNVCPNTKQQRMSSNMKQTDVLTKSISVASTILTPSQTSTIPKISAHFGAVRNYQNVISDIVPPISSHTDAVRNSQRFINQRDQYASTMTSANFIDSPCSSSCTESKQIKSTASSPESIFKNRFKGLSRLMSAGKQSQDTPTTDRGRFSFSLSSFGPTSSGSIVPSIASQSTVTSDHLLGSVDTTIKRTMNTALTSDSTFGHGESGVATSITKPLMPNTVASESLSGHGGFGLEPRITKPLITSAVTSRFLLSNTAKRNTATSADSTMGPCSTSGQSSIRGSSAMTTVPTYVTNPVPSIVSIDRGPSRLDSGAMLSAREGSFIDTPLMSSSYLYPMTNEFSKAICQQDIARPSGSSKTNSQEHWPDFAEEFSVDSNSEQSVNDADRPPKRKFVDEECLFSDDEEDPKAGVASQINRIQTFLKTDRLKRPKKHNKEPVV